MATAGWFIICVAVAPMIVCVGVLTYDVTKCYVGEGIYRRRQRRKEEAR